MFPTSLRQCKLLYNNASILNKNDCIHEIYIVEILFSSVIASHTQPDTENEKQKETLLLLPCAFLHSAAKFIRDLNNLFFYSN